MTAGPVPTLLASDLDGTLIPPNETRERLREVRRFRQVVDAMGLTLAYVTGRHLSLALDGIRRFGLPSPHALACDVGATLYWHKGGRYEADAAYRDAIARAPGVVEAFRIHEALADLSALRIQEPEKQGPFKASYYAAPQALPSLMATVQERLAELGRVRLVESHDPLTGAGLLDILPAAVGKAGAVRHVARRLGLNDEDVVFAGDSGNDRDALLSGVRAVLVANAPDALRSEIRTRAAAEGRTDRVFFASARFAAGVVQGLRHFSGAVEEPSTPRARS